MKDSNGKHIQGLCYSYILKRYGHPISPKEFLFFTSDSKRTFGWASYHILDKDHNSTVGRPENTVSIADFNLDKVIDELFLKISKVNPALFKMK